MTEGQDGIMGGIAKGVEGLGVGGTYLEAGPAADIPSAQVLIEAGAVKHTLKVGRTGSGGGPSHRMDTWDRGRGVRKEHAVAGFGRRRCLWVRGAGAWGRAEQIKGADGTEINSVCGWREPLI